MAGRAARATVQLFAVLAACAADAALLPRAPHDAHMCTCVQVSVYMNLRLLNKVKHIDYTEEVVLWTDEVDVEITPDSSQSSEADDNA